MFALTVETIKNNLDGVRPDCEGFRITQMHVYETIKIMSHFIGFPYIQYIYIYIVYIVNELQIRRLMS